MDKTETIKSTSHDFQNFKGRLNGNTDIQDEFCGSVDCPSANFSSLAEQSR